MQLVNRLGNNVCWISKKYLSRKKPSHSKWNMENAGIASKHGVVFLSIHPKRHSSRRCSFLAFCNTPQKMMLLQLPVDCKTQTNKNCSDFPESAPSQKRHAKFSHGAEQGSQSHIPISPYSLGLVTTWWKGSLHNSYTCQKKLNYSGGNQTQGMPENRNKLEYTLTTFLLPI